MLYRLAAAAAMREVPGLPLGGPLVLLDVAVADEATLELIAALAARASRVLATVPTGDYRTLAALRRLPGATESADADGRSARRPLARVRRFLFAADNPPAFDEATGPLDVTFFSAPGEERECVEIARAILQEATRGVRFDQIAILLRSPRVYGGLLETALKRAGIDAWFAKGTRAPDPAGRAFLALLALLACAAERLSARRFSEYLSLGQVPPLDAKGAPPVDRGRWVAPDGVEEVLPAAALPSQLSLLDLLDRGAGTEVDPRDTGAEDRDALPVSRASSS